MRGTVSAQGQWDKGGTMAQFLIRILIVILILCRQDSGRIRITLKIEIRNGPGEGVTSGCGKLAAAPSGPLSPVLRGEGGGEG